MKTAVKIVILLLSAFISLTANANVKDIVKVESQDQILIKEKNGVVKAKILFDENFKDSYDIEGIYQHSKLLNGKNKVEILWTKIQKDKSTINIKKPLNSTLVTKEDIKPKSIFKAQGDLKSLNNDLNDVLKMAKESLADKGVLSNNKNNIDGSDADKTNQNDNNSYQSGQGYSSVGTLGTTSSNAQPVGYTPTPLVDNKYPTSENTNELEKISSQAIDCKNIINENTIQFRKLIGNTCIENGDAVPIEITTKSCNPIIDYKTKEVFVSSRKVAFKDGGEYLVEDCKVDYDNPVALQSKTVGCDLVFRKDLLKQVQQEQLYFVFNTKDVPIGSCVDSDTTFDVSTYIETNKECQPLINYETKKVQFGYREVANVNGSIEEIKPCLYEQNTNELVSTYQDCEIRDDFTNKLSVQQEKFYYMFENKKVFAGECKDSTVVFPHYVTDDTCTPRQIGDDKVVFEKRVAYRDVNNIVNYITKCQPSTDGALPLFEEFCGYEHDFNNHQSYPQSRMWFNDPDTNNKRYLTECQKQPFNFPHKQELIRWDYDDELLVGIKHVKLYFTDDKFENTDVYISDDGSDDVALAPQPYVKSVQNLVFVEQLGYQRLDKVGNDFIFYGDDSKVIDMGGGLYPNYIDEVVDITSVSPVFTRLDDGHGSSTYYNYPTSLSVSYSNCVAGDIITSTRIKTVAYQNGFSSLSRDLSYTHKDCRKWNYYEKIDKYNLVTDFLRPDGSIYHESTKEVLRVTR